MMRDMRNLVAPEGSRTSVISYKTFHVIRDSEFFRPKLLVDSMGSETDPIEQITALYMKGNSSNSSHSALFFASIAWLLDQKFIEILKKVLPLQEHLHTLKYVQKIHFLSPEPLLNTDSFSYVGLNEKTALALVELCPLIKNLK